MSSFGTNSFSFGQQPQMPQLPQPQQSGGLFGTSQNSSASQPSLGAKRTQSFGGSQSTGSSLFGSNNKANNNGTSGGIFSQQTPSTPAVSGGSVFGTQSVLGNPSNGTGMFGSKPTQNPSTNMNVGSAGGLFGNTGNSTSSNPSGGLFGGQNNASSSIGSNTFGNIVSGGGSLGQQQPQTQSTGSSSLINTLGSANPNGSSTGTGMLGKPTGSTVSGGLFGSDPSQTAPLVAYVDQASYTLQGVSPSQKLYTSLTIPVTKRNRDSHIYDFASRPAVTKSRIASGRNKMSKSEFKAGVFSNDTSSNSGSLIPAKGTSGAFDSYRAIGKGEPRKWINSYENFLQEQPTTLVIKRDTSKPIGFSSLKIQNDMPVADAPPIIADVGLSEKEGTPQEVSAVMPKMFSPADSGGLTPMGATDPAGITVVRVNKQSLQEGYYIYPKLDALASMSKSQLSSVSHLVIGREKYGQIEYSLPVDLSHVSNLGDILGTLVVFEAGTVCVYPDEDRKKLPGQELNLPCTVTIENAWPLDAVTRHRIKDMEDPRMQKHISRLREACESRGGEFITFARGVWVFKVPHFSTWGLPANEMVVDSEDGLVANSDYDDCGMEDDDNNELDAENANDDFSRDFVYGSLGKPLTWAQQLAKTDSGLFQIDSVTLKSVSKPTQELILEDIILPQSPTEIGKSSKLAPTAFDDAVLNTVDGSDLVDIKKLSIIQMTVLQPYLHRESRKGVDLPRLHTNLEFADLISISPGRHELWNLLHIIHETSGGTPATKIDKIAQWFDKRVAELPVVNNADSLESVYLLLSRHKLEEAFNVALDSHNPHLAALISLLSDKEQLRWLNNDAKNQLNDWKAAKTLDNIPLAVRHIWELASGQQPTISTDRTNWLEWLGMRLWYSPDTTLKNAIASLPEKLVDVTNAELTFLQVSAGMKDVDTGLKQLDVVDGFLCLQALNTAGVKSASSDLICQKLSEQLDAAEEHVAAVYVALHIGDTELASKSIQKILLNGAVNISLPADFGVPEHILDEARAFQVAKVGDYVAEAEYLVRAGKYNEAHRVVLTTVGPRAVLAGKTTQIVDLLASLEKKKSDISNWETGGNIFLVYARAQLMGADGKSVNVLCAACRNSETPNLLSKRALSIISEWVSSTPFARSNLNVDKVMHMKFDPAQTRIQVLQQASRLLA